METGTFFQARINSLKRRALHLSDLKAAVDDSVGLDTRQWSLLNANLSAISSPILGKIQLINDRLLPGKDDVEIARKINATLGSLEITLAKAYNYFDTYLDVLTQRLSPELGSLLKGCDVLAYDAMAKDHPSLDSIERPLVYCDRGFGASIVREGVLFYRLASNPFPLIQIPYSKLNDKCNLVSVLHEVGHQTMVRLGLNVELPMRLKENLKKENAPTAVQELFALWCSEIGPDFWAFCCSGSAQSEGIREILSLPQAKVFKLNAGDPHPPPYIRVLISFAWCREFFGRGDWDKWTEEWKVLYPLHEQEKTVKELYQMCLPHIPAVIKTLVQQKWAYLQDRRLPNLFKIDDVSPGNLREIANRIKGRAFDFRNTKPSVQLALFRFLQSHNIFSGETLNRIMNQWLIALGNSRIN